MRLTRVLRKRIQSLLRRGKLEAELERELSLHTDQLILEYKASGMSDEDARLAAGRAFGSVALAQDQCRDTRRVNVIEDLSRDLAFTLRLLRKSPAFTLTAMLSLAIGIGANTAVFSLVQKVIFELLPVRDPESLVRLNRSNLARSSNTSFSNPFFRDLQNAQGLPFEGFLALSDWAQVTMIAGSGAEPVAAELVSGNFFELLGVRPALGRVLASDDDRTPGAHPVAILSHSFWQRRFAGDPAVLNRTIRLNNHPFTIVGVSAAGFDGMNPGASPDLRVPIMMEKELGFAPVPFPILGDRGSSWLGVFGRLKKGVTHSEAASSLMPVMSRALELWGTPRTDYDRRVRASERMVVTPGPQGQANLRGRFASALWALWAIVATVLLLACVNIAHLLLARTAARNREFSIRLATGASRGRLIRQILTESVLLALCGAVTGLVLARALSQLLVGMVVSDHLHSTLDAAPNPIVLAFNFSVALLAGVLFGLVPAVRAAQAPNPGLKGEQAVRGRRLTGRKLMISFQVAASLVLLTGAGLFLRTIHGLYTTDLGFRSERILQFRLDPASYPPAEVHPFGSRVRERIASLPGVSAVAVSRQRLMDRGRWSSGISVEGYTPPEGEASPLRDGVSAGYFSALGIPLVAGREFTNFESTKVAIVNQTFARHYFGGSNPLGKRIGPGGGPPEHTIVGVAKDAKYANVREQTPRFWYVPWQQLDPGHFHAFTVSVRTSVEPESLINAIRHEIRAIERNVAMLDIRTLEAQINENVMLERLLASLSVFFGAVAALLAAIGLFGVLSYSVSQRNREIGIRVALGATPARVMWSILRDMVVFCALGLAAGLATALALTRLLDTMLFGVKPNDPVSMVAACLVMIGIAAFAAVWPARRAASVDPAVAFRSE